ncbi:MAG: GntR family transcriptional regulator [Rhodothermales bacterium]
MSTSQTKAEQAYAIVEQLVVTLELPPGHVFSEAELSQRIGIGRTPLREALQRLAYEGLLEAMPRRGIRVTDIEAGGFLGLLETRRVLDRLMVSSAAAHATAAQRQGVLACARTMLEAGRERNLSAFMEADQTSNEWLDAAAGLPFAARAVAPLHTHCRRFWVQHHHHADLDRSVQLHIDLMQHVAASEVEHAAQASDALLDYLTAFARHALRLV